MRITQKKRKSTCKFENGYPRHGKMYSYLIKMLLTLNKSHVDVQQIYQIMIKFLTVFLLLFTELFADLWEQDVTRHIQIGLAETGYKRVDLKCGASSFLVNVTLENDFEGVVYTRGSFDNKTSSCFQNHEQAIPFENNSVLITLNIPFNECHTVMIKCHPSFHYRNIPEKNICVKTAKQEKAGSVRNNDTEAICVKGEVCEYTSNQELKVLPSIVNAFVYPERIFEDVGDSQYRKIVVVQHDPEFITPGDAAFALDCSFTPEFKMTTNVVTEPDYKSRITLVDADPGSDIVLKDEKYQSRSDQETVSFLPVAARSKDEL